MSWLSDLFGGKKKEQSDPLAGVRAQLQELSSQIPGLVARQKENIAKEIGAQREEGIKGIGEQVYADRGLGRTSIYDRLRTELVDKLARSQAQAELAADEWGMGQQSDILSRIGSMTPQEQPELESPISKILGNIGLGIGQNLGLGKNTTGTDGDGKSIFQSASDLIKGTSGSKTTTENQYDENSGGFMDIAKLAGKGAMSFIPGGSFISELFG